MLPVVGFRFHFFKLCFWNAISGDPTVFGNLPVPTEAEDAIIDQIKGKKYNGYNPSIGEFKTHSSKLVEVSVAKWCNV